MGNGARARVRDVAISIAWHTPEFLARCIAKAGDGGRISGAFSLDRLKAAREASLHLDRALVALRRSHPGISTLPEWRVVERLHQASLVCLLSPENRTPDVRRFLKRALRSEGGC
jgi:nicotinate-nucleotide pyrophosphorylase